MNGNSLSLCGLPIGLRWPIGGLIAEQIKDWDGVTGLRGSSDPIPGSTGSYPREGEVRESRIISIKGTVVADDIEQYHRARSALEAIPMVGEMRFDSGDGVWVRRVEVKAINVDDHRGSSVTGFTVDLEAHDPNRYRDATRLGPYGLPVRSGGLRLPRRFPWNFGVSTAQVAQVENTGTIPTYPKITVSGKSAGVTVRVGPRRLSFGAFQGDLVFDCRDRRAFLDGVDVTRRMVRREWAAVPAGAVWDVSHEHTSPAADTSMSVEFQIGVK